MTSRKEIARMIRNTASMINEMAGTRVVTQKSLRNLDLAELIARYESTCTRYNRWVMDNC